MYKNMLDKVREFKYKIIWAHVFKISDKICKEMLRKDFSLASVLTFETDKYLTQVLMSVSV